MFDTLNTKIRGAFNAIRGKSVITQKELDDTLRLVRMALLEADVNFKVAKEFCDNIATKALGENVLKSLTPDKQIIKIVNQELTNIMGENASELKLSVAPPAIIMLVGLQGSGKTTTCVKLAKYIKKEFKKSSLLVPADVYRPAAIEQLKTLGKQNNIEVFDANAKQAPVKIVREAKKLAENQGTPVMIVDTAGRLQIDKELMKELKLINKKIMPTEILLVADAMTGQEAVNVALGFLEAVPITGLILTKLDGDARGGAALSMKKVTGVPIKFIGTGEKSDALEIFHPDRMASRILGMGDVLTLIEKATENFDLEESKKLEQKFKKNEFSFDDFLSQLKMIKKMGSFSSILGMIPMLGDLTKKVNDEDANKEMRKIEAIILSMTKKERNNANIINGSRRLRIARGSGTKVEDVNQLLKQFMQMKQMMKKINTLGVGNMMKSFKNLRF
ncbi:MAG: signal recognition particle protein [Bdellovibrionota bacterium]